MALEFSNAKIRIYRETSAQGETQVLPNLASLLTEVDADIQRDKDATPGAAPWAEPATDDNSVASHLIYIDLTGPETDAYYPRAGDRIEVVSSPRNRLNGEWAQVAATVEEYDLGMDYVALPSVRFKRG